MTVCAQPMLQGSCALVGTFAGAQNRGTGVHCASYIRVKGNNCSLGWAIRRLLLLVWLTGV